MPGNLGPLYAVTAITNPVRYRTRPALYRDFAKRCADAGVELYTAEAAFGDRPHEVTERGNPHHIQLRTNHELWHKENLLNVAVQHLSRQRPGWEYVAWVDADVHFARPDWAAETVHQLQHHAIVQMFSHTVDLDPAHAPCSWFYGDGLKPAGWGYCHVHQLPKANTDLRKTLADGRMSLTTDGRYGEAAGDYYWHPGFAWAARRATWDALGGLIDFSIVGAADYLMAASLTGDVTVSDWLAPSYRRWVMEWKARADRYVRGDVGYVPGLLLHAWHGRKSNRGYRDRWRILHDNGFDPDLDLKRDGQGLYQLTDRSPGLRDGLRAYFRARSEDCIYTG